jgi:hypothetical protein
MTRLRTRLRQILYVILAFIATSCEFQPALATPVPAPATSSYSDGKAETEFQLILSLAQPEVLKVKPLKNPEGLAVVKAIAKQYKQPELLINNLYFLAEKYARDDFPQRDDILAIMATESSFSPSAANGGSYGVMQILFSANYKLLKRKFDLDEQVRVGSLILSSYFKQLKGDQKAAVLAYNAGVGGYLKFGGKKTYHEKYSKHKSWILALSTE